jgi:UDPglucose 6-dehydrogenase
VKRFGADLSGRRFALWGLAFKPNTNDMREASSRVVIDALLARGAKVPRYDPIAADEAREIYDGNGSSNSRLGDGAPRAPTRW